MRSFDPWRFTELRGQARFGSVCGLGAYCETDVGYCGYLYTKLTCYF